MCQNRHVSLHVECTLYAVLIVANFPKNGNIFAGTSMRLVFMIFITEMRLNSWSSIWKNISFPAVALAGGWVHPPRKFRFLDAV